MNDDRVVQNKPTASEVATIVAGWSTALALALGFVTFTITFRAQEKFNEDQRKFNEAQQRFNEDQRKFSIAQQDALTKQAAFQSETAAIDALRAYFTAGIESANAADKPQWLTNDAFFTAETLYNLRSDDGGWRETAKGLVLNRRAVIDSGRFDCEKYSRDFVKFVREEVVRKDPCSKPTNR
jgi:hypothetical protein